MRSPHSLNGRWFDSERLEEGVNVLSVLGRTNSSTGIEMEEMGGGGRKIKKKD